MNNGLFKPIFAVIFAGNLGLAIWSCLKGDIIGSLISSAIVLLIAVLFLVARSE